MELVYFLEDISKKYDLNISKSKEDLEYLYSLLPNHIKDKKIELNVSTCSFIIKSGVRRFQECGYPVIEEKEYCEKHLEYNFKKLNPELYKENKKEELKKIEREKKNETKISLVAKRQLKSTDILLVKNKYNHILWPNSNLVFSSFKDKYIIGTEDKEGQLVELNEEDIKKCIEYKLPYKR